MQLSEKGEKIIKGFEGFKLKAYKDSAGVWTIGYGSTHYHDGKVVKPGDKLANIEQADALFRNTIAEYVNAVNSYVRVTLNQDQFDALVSFTYNEGTGALKHSTLLQKLNKGDYEDAANQFLLWDKITNGATDIKEVSADLAQRRNLERRLFLSAANKTIL